MYRIGLDYRPLEPDFRAHAGRGTGRYTSELVNQLLSFQDLEFKFSFFKSKDLQYSKLERKFIDSLPFGKRTIESQFFYPRLFRKFEADFLHFFCHTDASAFCAKPYFVTVLDLIPQKFPHLYNAANRNLRFKFARYLETYAIKKAAGILAISEATAKDVEEMLGYPRERIIITPLAVSESFAPLAGTEEEVLRQKQTLKESFEFGRDESFLLYVGGIDPRKNVLFMVDVFAKVKEHFGSIKPLKLLMVGRYEHDDQYPLLRSKIAELGLTNDVKLCGFVADEILPQYYQMSDLMLFPSLYEGFGLPVLEAMASGCPVVAGNNSSLPEVVGATGSLLPDNDLDSWSREVIAIVENSQRTNQMRIDGLAQASKFSWESCALKTIEGYRWFAKKYI